MILKVLRTFCVVGVLMITFLSTSHAFATDPVDPSALTPDQAKALIEQQKKNVNFIFDVGSNAEKCVFKLNGTTVNIINGQANRVEFFKWFNIFNTAYWIPVVPDECTVCKGEPAQCPYGVGKPVPLPLNLIPLIIVRLYGLIASISVYALFLVFVVVGIRFMVGGLSKRGSYTDTAKNLRDVFSALIITLTIATIFLQILYNVLGLDANLAIKGACIPTTDPAKSLTRYYCSL